MATSHGEQKPMDGLDKEHQKFLEICVEDQGTRASQVDLGQDCT